jgi:acyl-CoA-binding protein
MVESSDKSALIEQAFLDANKFMNDPTQEAFDASNSDKLLFYGLYKQSTEGENKRKYLIILVMCEYLLNV